MSECIHDIILQISHLLRECGWDKQAAWYLERSSELRRLAAGTPEYLQVLNDLDRSISGMGSMSDIPLSPISSNMSPQEAKAMQWRLSDSLGASIDKLLDRTK